MLVNLKIQHDAPLIKCSHLSKLLIIFFKLEEGRLRPDIRKKIFTMRVVRHLHRISPSLETFKVRLDRALSNLVKLKMSLLIAGGWTR